MTRIALCLRGSSALRVRLVPVGEAGADGKRVSGAGAHKAVLHQVDATQLELACAAVLNALSLGGVVCETDTLQHLDNTAQDVQGTPLERACLWRAALEALVSTGHVTRLGRWYTAARSYCAPMEAVAPSGEQRASVTVAVQPSRGRLVELRRPNAARGTRRTRALGRVRKIRRPHVKTERRVQRKAPKNGEHKPAKKIVRRVTFVAGI